MLPTAAVGTVTVGTNGDISFSGYFATPRSPAGKDANKLDDTEKDDLISALHAEMDDVDDLQRWLELEKELSRAPPDFRDGKANIMSAFIGATVKMVVPPTILSGEPAKFSAMAHRKWGPELPAARYAWHFSDGAVFTGKVIQRTFKQPGKYSVRLTVGDRYGLRIVQRQEIVVGVRPRKE